MDVTLLTYDDLFWPLGRQESTPEYRLGCGNWPRSHKIDPYPCYTHDVEKVRELTAECEEAFPLTGTKTACYLLSHEDIDRINGVTFSDTLYKQKGESTKCGCGCDRDVTLHPLATWIVLPGKRIPPHPAMTRYLISHEYGHMVWNHILKMLKYSDGCENKLYELYMKTRGVADYTTTYSGGKWHLNPGEIMANDFRLIFTNQEREFWPHPVPLPEETPIVEWWANIHIQATGGNDGKSSG